MVTLNGMTGLGNPTSVSTNVLSYRVAGNVSLADAVPVTYSDALGPSRVASHGARMQLRTNATHMRATSLQHPVYP